MPNLHTIEVKRSAHVYTLGKLSDKTENIWVVLHGYSMLAQYFIAKFDHLDLERNFIIAPEGLSRFYQNGFSGRVGASWMTSHERESEIKDYIQYLNDVHRQFVAPNTPQVNTIALGFSQGVSTLLRWLNNQNYTYNHIIAWAGSLPEDVLDNYLIRTSTLQLCYGTEDPFFSAEVVKKVKESLNQRDINSTTTIYNGAHTLIRELINEDLISK